MIYLINFVCDDKDCNIVRTTPRSDYANKKNHYCSRPCFFKNRIVIISKETKIKRKKQRQKAFSKKWKEPTYAKGAKNE